MSLPTQRTLKYFRAKGFDAAVVERYLTIPGRPHGVRQDAFGFIDIIAFSGDVMIAIQATSTSNIGSRIKKIAESRVARRWMQGYPYRKVLVIGWKKYAKPVDRKWWRPTLRWLTEEDLNAAARGQQSRQSATVS